VAATQDPHFAIDGQSKPSARPSSNFSLCD
jgi:hypothetical protein